MDKLVKVMLVIAFTLFLVSQLTMTGCSPQSSPTPGEELTTYPLEVNLFGEKNEFAVDSQGVLKSEVEVSSADGRISLSLDKGTTLLDKDGKPLRIIHVGINRSPPPPPEDAYIVSSVYDLEPKGATFEPRLLLTLSYDPEKLPEGVRDSELYVAYYSGSEWCNVGYRKVDSKPYSVTTHLHDLNFTTFAILGPKELALPTHQPTTGTRVGNLAPDFELQNLDGQFVSLSGLRGKQVLVNFWATRCPPCRSEMPYLQEIYNEWSETELILLAINIGEGSTKVKEFMQSHNLSLPVLLDTNQGVALAYNIRYIPTTFLIDKRGIIQATKVGAFSSKREIEGILTNKEHH